MQPATPSPSPKRSPTQDLAAQIATAFGDEGLLPSERAQELEQRLAEGTLTQALWREWFGQALMAEDERARTHRSAAPSADAARTP